MISSHGRPELWKANSEMKISRQQVTGSALRTEPKEGREGETETGIQNNREHERGSGPGITWPEPREHKAEVACPSGAAGVWTTLGKVASQS